MTFSVADHVRSGNISISFEFFPPQTDMGERNLWQTVTALEPLAPTFVSVTYGAGGTTRDRTRRITEKIARETSLLPVAHLTCVGATAAELQQIVADYGDSGVHHILALRGDPPTGVGTPWQPHPGGLNHAVDLVALVKNTGNFVVGVAAFPEGHPEADSLKQDAQVLLAKQQAGADFAVTQFFFHADDYLDLVKRAHDLGVTIPIIPGVMPVTNVKQIERFAQLSGAAFPEDVALRFRSVADDEQAVVDLGVQVATELCEQVLAHGAPGLHFYTLNRSSATTRVFQNLVADGILVDPAMPQS